MTLLVQRCFASANFSQLRQTQTPVFALLGSTLLKALTAEKLPGSEVRLSWKRPEEDGGVGVDYYQVERAEAGSVESWLACGRSKENGFVVKGMLSGKTYR